MIAVGDMVDNRDRFKEKGRPDYHCVRGTGESS